MILIVITWPSKLPLSEREALTWCALLLQLGHSNGNPPKWHNLDVADRMSLKIITIYCKVFTMNSDLLCHSYYPGPIPPHPGPIPRTPHMLRMPPHPGPIPPHVGPFLLYPGPIPKTLHTLQVPPHPRPIPPHIAPHWTQQFTLYQQQFSECHKIGQASFSCAGQPAPVLTLLVVLSTSYPLGAHLKRPKLL